MANGLVLTDEQLDALSDESREELLNYIERVGPTAASVPSRYERLLRSDVRRNIAPPQKETQQLTRQVRTQATDTAAQRVRALEVQRDINVNRGMTVAEAEQKALEDVRDVERRSRAVTVEGETTAQPEEDWKDVVRTSNNPLAVLAAVARPKVVDVEAPLTDEEKEARKSIRLKLLAEPILIANREAQEKNITGDERIQYLADRARAIRNVRINEIFTEYYHEIKQQEFPDIGRYDPIPEGQEGRAKVLRQLAAEQRDQFIRDVFPRQVELFDLDPGFVETYIRDVADEGNIVQRNLAKAALATGRLGRRVFRRDDEETGQVSETYVGAATRVLFELMSPRAITYPIMKSLTWDRNPETGLPYDPEDPRYLLDRALDEKLEKLYQNQYDASQGRELSFPEVGTGTEATAATGLGPLGLLRAIVPDPRALFISGFDVEEDMNTGSDWRDYFLTVGAAEWSGDDVGRLENIDNVPPIFSTMTGFAIELGAPAQMMPLVAATRASKAITKITSAQAIRMADAIQFDNAGEFLRNVNRWADDQASLTETLAARRAFKDIRKAEGKPAPKEDVRAIETHEDFANKMAPSISDGIAAVEVTADPLKSKAFSGVPKDSAYGRTLRTIAQKRDQLVLALKQKNPIDVLRRTPVGRDLLVSLQEAAAAMPRATEEAIVQRALINITQKEMAGLLQDAMPTGWYRVSQNMVVRKAAYLANKQKIESRARELSKAEVKYVDGKERFRYTNNTKSYVAAVAGGGARAFTGANAKILEKVKKGEWLTPKEYLRMQTYINDSAVESVLGAVGKSPLKGRNISQRVYEGAKKASVDREIGIIDGTRDFFRGVRSTINGQSPIIRSMFPTSGGGKLINRDIRKFNTKIDPVIADVFGQLTNKLNELPNAIIREIGNAKEGQVDEMLKGVASENPFNDYMDFINLFFKPLQDNIGDLFTKQMGVNEVEVAIKGAIQDGTLPPVISLAGMRKSIDIVYETAQGGDLLEKVKSAAIKKGRFGFISSNSMDNIGMGSTAYIISKRARPLYDEAFQQINDIEEGVFIRTPERSPVNGYAYRAEVLRSVLLANKVDTKLTEKLVKVFRQAVDDTFSPTDVRRLANDVIEYTVSHGFLPGQGQRGQMYQAIKQGVSNVQGAGEGLKSKWGRLEQTIREAFPDNPVELQRTQDAVANAYLEALTNIDTDRVYGLFNQQGILPKAIEAGKVDGARDSVPAFIDMRGTDLSVLGPTMADHITKYSKFDEYARVNEQLKSFRPEFRNSKIIITDGISWTRKMTISGLLAGWGYMPGLRYMSQNGITAPFITAVSAPANLMTSIVTMPPAIAGGVMRGLRRAGFVRSSDAYDAAAIEMIGAGPRVKFVSANGTMWTQDMIDQAAARQNIRFSRSTYDFQVDMLRETQRQMRVGPGGKPVYEMDVYGGKYAGSDPRAIAEYWDWFRPDRKNLFSIIAEEMDNIQREAAFRNALKIGADEATAGMIARNSMLDYGAIPEKLKEAASRYLAFFAFRYRMSADFFGAMLRGGEGARNIGRTGALIKSQYEDMQEWVITPDYLRSRLWKTQGKEFKQFMATQYGPGVPWSEGLLLLGNLHEMFFNNQKSLLNKIGIAGIGLADQLDPRIQQGIALYQDASKLTSSSFAPEGYVPSAFLLSCGSIPGAWEMAKNWYNLVPVAKEKERPDLPRVDGRQWRFGPGGKVRFALTELLRLSTANKRWVDDYFRLFARFGISSDNVDFRKDEDGTPLGFMLGETTASILNNPEYIELAQQQFLYFAYLQMAKRP